MATRHRAVWVDDRHALLRRGIVACLVAEGFDVRGESAALDPEPPLADLDVLVLEASPVAVGYARDPGWPTGLSVVATVRMPPALEVRALALAGVGAFLDRDGVTPAALSRAVTHVGSGTVTVPVAAFEAMLPTDRDGRVSALRPPAPREREVLRLLAEGCDTRSIGGTLSYSERTVKNIVHDLLVKLDCRTRAQAVGVATRAGWI